MPSPPALAICSTSSGPHPASNTPGSNDSSIHARPDRTAPGHSPRSGGDRGNGLRLRRFSRAQTHPRPSDRRTRNRPIPISRGRNDAGIERGRLQARRLKPAQPIPTLGLLASTFAVGGGASSCSVPRTSPVSMSRSRLFLAGLHSCIARLCFTGCQQDARHPVIPSMSLTPN